MMDFANTCRTCMNSVVNMVNIFQPMKTEENASLLVAEALAECTSGQISQQDGLPQNLCGECFKTLQISFTFRHQAIKAEKELRILFIDQEPVKNEPNDHQIELMIEQTNHIQDYEDCCDPDDVKYEQNEEIKIEADQEKIFTCNQCLKQYYSERKYNKHLLTHKGNNDSNTEIKLKVNGKKTSGGKKNHACTICNQRFKRESSLIKHMLSHSETVNLNALNTELEAKLFKCSKCDMEFLKSRALSSHMKKHSKKKDLHCDICGLSFTLKTNLKRHIKLHYSVANFECKQCTKIFSRKDQYKEHMKKHEGIKSNVCPYCNKAFMQVSNLKDHIRTHTGETPYLCSECGKGFANSSNLRQHLIRHSGLKPYTCNLCPMTFSTKGQMTCHMGTHSGAHPHKCDQCGAAFTKAPSLKKHMLIHLGIKPFECDTCFRRFNTKDHLKRHYRIHTGEKPYRCKYCERCFSQSNDMLKHLRTHVGVNIYQCTVCDMRFRLISDLKKHYPSHYANASDLTAFPPFDDLQSHFATPDPTDIKNQSRPSAKQVSADKPIPNDNQSATKLMSNKMYNFATLKPNYVSSAKDQEKIAFFNLGDTKGVSGKQLDYSLVDTKVEANKMQNYNLSVQPKTESFNVIDTDGRIIITFNPESGVAGNITIENVNNDKS